MAEERILVTGATGFVGRMLCERLVLSGRAIRRVVRRGHPERSEDDYLIDDIRRVSDWSSALADVFAIVHLAARVHVFDNRSVDAVEEFRDVNARVSRDLFEAAARASVRKFVFLSSVKAMGEKTFGKAFTETDVSRPTDPYGMSKLEAENVLGELARKSDTALTILRPPLMYGPWVKGNFLNLLRAVDRGIPLPIGSIVNRRSLLYVGNLVDAIVRCIDDPRANGHTYLLSDGEDLSTPALVQHIADALGRRANIVKCPTSLLRLLGRLSMKSRTMDRLTESLQVDISRIKRDLEWKPPVSIGTGLSQTAEWFARLHRG